MTDSFNTGHGVFALVAACVCKSAPIEQRQDASLDITRQSRNQVPVISSYLLQICPALVKAVQS